MIFVASKFHLLCKEFIVESSPESSPGFITSPPDIVCKYIIMSNVLCACLRLLDHMIEHDFYVFELAL